MQGFKFEVELRVLGVPGYDLILGVDWLSQHEPTLTYWSKGIMHLQYKGRKVKLQAQLEGSAAEIRLCEASIDVSKEEKKGNQIYLAQLFSQEDQSINK